MCPGIPLDYYGFFAMKFHLSRFETLEHGDVQYGRGDGDLCVPRSSLTHLGTQRSTTLRVRRESVCSKVSVTPCCKMVRILWMLMNTFIELFLIPQ